MRDYDALSDEKLLNLNSSEMPIGRKCGTSYIPWWVEEGRKQLFLERSPYVRAIWMWKEMARRCHQFFSSPEVVATGRVMLLKYEDLLANPVSIGQQVLEHLAENETRRFQSRLLRIVERRSKTVGVYKERDPAELAAGERIAQAELSLYQYDSRATYREVQELWPG